MGIEFDKLKKDLAGIKINLENTIKKIQKRQNMEVLAKEGAELIKKRTRLGKGVDPNGNQTKLTKLAKSTVKQRKKKDLSSLTSPGKSNLTQSGKMLDGIYGRSKGDGVGEILINNKSHEGGLTNRELAEIHDQGLNPKIPKREFFNLSTSEQNAIRKILRDLIRKLLK